MREEAVERVCELLYEAAAVSETWPKALTALADATGGVNAHFAFWSARQQSAILRQRPPGPGLGNALQHVLWRDRPLPRAPGPSGPGRLGREPPLLRQRLRPQQRIFQRFPAADRGALQRQGPRVR